MKAKLLSLFLVLMLLQTCGYAAIIERFSIKAEGKDIIFVEDDKNVGRVINNIKPNVQKVLYKGKTFFMKDMSIKSKKLELRNKIGSIIASYILNHIFKDKEKRYPLLSLAFDSAYLISDVEPFHVLSEDLIGFTSIADIAEKQPYQKTKIKVDDLENLYMGMYLVGGGDPHMRNIFYNSQNHYLGSVDLDVSFKEHKPYDTQRQLDEISASDFFKKYLDLAIRTIDCNNIFANFLFDTDSRLKQKINWNMYYDMNIPLYQETIRMNGTRLSESIDTLRGVFPDKEKLRISVTNTVNDIKKDLKEIINKKLQLDANKERFIFNDSGDYFDKDSDTYKKYKEDSLIKSIYFLFDDNEDYIQEIYQFI